MKKSEFVNLIKEAVVPELRKVVREELQMMKQKRVPTSKIIEHGIEMSKIVDIPKKKNKPTKLKKRNFTKNQGINEILNETALGMEKKPEEYKTMNGGAITKDMARGWGMDAEQMFGPTSDKPAVSEMVPEDKKHIEIPDVVQKALTRDYSKLVKAMNVNKGA
tara:strand:- start:54459 stop:54947 length:489 start_codon:yes stop_codon:yes gene_type:complete